MHETNPTFDGLADELVIEILEYALTYEKPLREVLSRAFTPRGRGPLQLGLFRVNKSIHRLAIDIFYAKNDFTVNFDNIKIEKPPVYFASPSLDAVTNRPTGSIPTLNSVVFRPLHMAHLTIDNFGSNEHFFPIDDDANMDLKTFTNSLLAYFKASPHIKTLTLSCVSATNFLDLWKELQTYDATATAIGEIEIPRPGGIFTLQLPDLTAAWKSHGRDQTLTGSNLHVLEHNVTVGRFVSSLLTPFFEIDPADNVARLRLQRRPGEPKRFLAFNLALLTCLSQTESSVVPVRYWGNLPGVGGRRARFVWREGKSKDQIEDFDEEPTISNMIYKRTMVESQGWYGDADWSGDEVWYNQLCTEATFKTGLSWQEVQENGGHTGEKWLRSFWKTREEYKTYSLYRESIWPAQGLPQIDPLRGILRK